MSARERILARLRAAPQSLSPLPPDVSGFYAAERSRPAGDERARRIARFCEQMAGWHGEVITVTRRGWAAALRQLCVAKQVGTLLYGRKTPYANELENAGIAGLTPYDRPVDEWKTELFRDIDAGFTTTRGGIAETGTLIVWPDADEPRLLSLVPPIHFALLDADALHDTLFDALRAQGWSAAPMPSNALLISGPSKTSDIQVTVAYGAHGPKELIVLLIDDEGGL
jgi:L-lactate dehydrogenase complex protein LldG